MRCVFNYGGSDPNHGFISPTIPLSLETPNQSILLPMSIPLLLVTQMFGIGAVRTLLIRTALLERLEI